MNDKKVIEINIRGKIYNYILENPGMHISKISSDLKIPRTTLIYHLNLLEKKELIFTKDKEMFRRYFCKNKVGKNEKLILSILRQRIPHKIIMYFIFHNNIASQVEISKYLNKHPTTVSFHLKKLKKLGLLDSNKSGREVKYYINYESELYEFFIKYNKCILNQEIPFALEWWEFMIKSQRIDKIIDGVFEIFPNPYHV